MDLVPRTVIIIAFVFLLARSVGKRELSSLEPFDVIMLVVIGDLVQQGITQNDDSVTGTIIVLSTLALVVVGLSYLNLRAPRLRKVLAGEPVVLVVDGAMVERNMRRERITTEDLLAEARQQQLSSLDEVRWAILETGGNISFIPKQQS
jgi:uncharacterized membrane protein YcaP (DUF421 family)